MLNQILWTAIVTPFDAGGEKIDYQSLERLLKLQDACGNGIVLLGSTGEALSLTDSEKRKVVEFACGLNLKTSMIIGVPGTNLHQALEWINFCHGLPIAGYLMTTPIYTRPGVLGQTAWFEKLLEKAHRPAMLYNIPGRAGIRLHPETVKNLAQHEKFLAIKDSTGSVDSLVEYKIVAPKIAIFCGDDYLMPAAAAEGAAGLVSVASNAWPTATRLYVTKALNGEKLSSKIWWQACKALFLASNPIPIKALLHDIGLITQRTVRLPLSAQDLSSIEALREVHQKILTWEAENHHA